MKHRNLYRKQIVAAGGVLLLAAILISACRTLTPIPESPLRTTATLLPPASSTTTALTGDSPDSTATPALAQASPTLTPLPSLTPTQPSLEPTPTEPVAPQPASPALKGTEGLADTMVYTVTVQLPTYPMWNHLIQEIDPLYNIPVLYLNRSEYEASAPGPTPIDYEGVVLENTYLRLTFLPEIGGRLYSAIVKSTGQEIFLSQSGR